jgi:hypothetical protein
MSKSPGQLTSNKDGTSDSDSHAMATHASSKLLHGQVERGELRTGTPLAKFQAAAKKVAVTNEVRPMLISIPNKIWYGLPGSCLQPHQQCSTAACARFCCCADVSVHVCAGSSTVVDSNTHVVLQVLEMLQSCQKELRQVQADYKEGQKKPSR